MDEGLAGSSQKMTDETFILLRDFVYEQSGIYFADNKKGQLEARLSLRLKANNLADLTSITICSSTTPTRPGR